MTQLGEPLIYANVRMPIHYQNTVCIRRCLSSDVLSASSCVSLLRKTSNIAKINNKISSKHVSDISVSHNASATTIYVEGTQFVAEPTLKAKASWVGTLLGLCGFGELELHGSCLFRKMLDFNGIYFGPQKLCWVVAPCCGWPQASGRGIRVRKVERVEGKSTTDRSKCFVLMTFNSIKLLHLQLENNRLVAALLLRESWEMKTTSFAVRQSHNEPLPTCRRWQSADFTHVRVTQTLMFLLLTAIPLASVSDAHLTCAETTTWHNSRCMSGWRSRSVTFLQLEFCSFCQPTSVEA